MTIADKNKKKVVPRERFTLFSAHDRGHSITSWLSSFHVFSFGDFHDTARVGFGKLRVLNDDRVAAGTGFGEHPHSNMEIVSIVLAGTLAHKDSTGITATIPAGSVQRMSAGTGVFHSEKNPSKTEEVHFLQLWILPQQRNIRPGYQQKHLDTERNVWHAIASGHPRHGELSINQRVRIRLGHFDRGQKISLEPLAADEGILLYVIEGAVAGNNISLTPGDALGIRETPPTEWEITERAIILSVYTPLEP